jgi:DNA-binding MarR family transcriptional regulator
MHTSFFALKRAHHSVLRLGRRLLGAMGLTAARFDLLYAIRIHDRRRIPQGELQRVLGVCRATVSRMLASLEELGLVRRRVDEKDRRRKLVELTTRGRWRIGFAHRQLTRSGWAELALHSALSDGGKRFDWSDPAECSRAQAQLERALDDVREAFGDVGSLRYEPDFDEMTDLDILDEIRDEAFDREEAEG